MYPEYIKREKMSEDNQNINKPGDDDIIKDVTYGEYKYGFVSDIDTDVIPQGLNEDVVRLISKKKTSRNGCLNSG